MSAELSPPLATEQQQVPNFSILDRARDLAASVGRKVGRVAAVGLMAVPSGAAMYVAGEMAAPSPAVAYDANTGDYPWWDATTLNASTSDYGYETCPSSASGCKTKTYVKDGKTYGEYDAWNYYFRNCTSYVAWRLNHEFGINPAGLGNATRWNDNAKQGWSVDQTPEIGDIAHFEGNDNNQTASPGHVAIVEEIGTGANAGKVRIAEYNQQLDGNFRSNRWLATSAISNFIDVNGANPQGFTLKLGSSSGGGGSGGGGGGGPTPPPIKHYADYMIYRYDPNSDSGYWYAKSSSHLDPTPVWGAAHGSSGDVPIVADFDGDGYDDYGIYRVVNGTGYWYVKSGGSSQPIPSAWGVPHGGWSQDIPVAGDFDGDGKADFGIYRMESDSTGRWYVKSSKTNNPTTPVWGWAHGSPGDIPVVGDFNGDNVDDYGIHRLNPNDSTGYWYVRNGGDGSPTPVWGWTHGSPGDKPIVGDFNGDNVDDYGVYRAVNGTGNWYVRSGGDGNQIAPAWGVPHGGWSQDIALAGDFGRN